ncbi:hypothetical protein BDW69DRAFT_31181 [Aspergillus filifer]
MNQPTHIIDPDGEVVIILHHANSPFAQPDQALLPKLGNVVQHAAKEFESSTIPIEEPTPVVVDDPALEAADEPTPEVVGDPATEAADEEPAEKPIEPELICESPGENCFRIKVSAKHLILASSVFKNMLTGGWEESIDYLQKGSVEITAESWDIDVFMILLRIIHCKYSRIPQQLDLESLAKIAVLADYYDCKEAIELAAVIWIKALKESVPETYSRDLVLWVWVSWYFQLPFQFDKATSTAMSWCDNGISNLGLPIPDYVIRLMNVRREEAINDLVVQLHGICDTFLSGSRGCSFECSSIMYGALTKQMQSDVQLSPKPAAPFPGLTYNHLVRKILSLKSPVWYTSSGRSHRCSDSSFTRLIGKFDDHINGLDLYFLAWQIEYGMLKDLSKMQKAD